ncbi:MAG: hypothetical protein M3384_19925, partial [Acidobacteriota bacterium]|nr:hypothetical protein [Acidobacteriota bacterium]
MKEKHIQILGICLTAVYGLFVAWLYVAEPKSLVELPTRAQQTIERATTTAQVMTNTYEIDQARFNEGLAAFRQENFVLARDAFSRADTERRDARTQFYIAYSFYRQGWGRVSNDDTLFRQGLETVNHAIALDRNFKADDANLQLKTPVELKTELEQGLQLTAEDFN